MRSRHLSKTIVLFLSLALVSVAGPPAASQEGPTAPYVLSEAIQTRARTVQAWDQLAKDFGLNPGQFPVLFQAGKGREVLQFYLDMLSAADVMAKARMARQGRKAVETDDLDIMLASECVFIPNKPKTQALPDISKTVRQRLVGAYVSPSKREAIMNAMQPLLFQGTKTDLFAVLEGLKSVSDYNARILDTEKLK